MGSFRDGYGHEGSNNVRGSSWFWRRARVVLACTTLALFVSSCRADVSIHVDVENNGSGIVTVELLLDDESTIAVVDLERSGLAMSDMAQAGWRLKEPEDIDGGGSRIVAEKDFGTAEQFAEIMNELSGDDGIFQEFELERTRSFARVEYDMSGRIDTTSGLDSFVDPELQKRLDSSVEKLGTSVEGVADNYQVSPDNVGIEFSAALPGDITEGQTNGRPTVEDDKTTVRWGVDLASDKVSQVQATSETRKVSALVFRGLAVVAGVVAALLIIAQLFRRFGSEDDPKKLDRNRYKRKPQLDGRKTNGAPPPSIVGGEADPTQAEAVILDGMGVLYQEADDINKLLIPFVRSRGSIKTNDEIWQKARAMSLGRLTTNQFWKDVGLNDEATVLDREYVANHQLSPGVIRYMRALRDHGIRVGCIVNGATTWAEGLRSAHSLEALIDPWIVSGSVGVRKPDVPLLEVVRRLCGLPPGMIRIVDDDLDILDSVRSQGYLTAWFSPNGTVEEARGHPLLQSFDREVIRLAKERGQMVGDEGS